MRRLGVLAALVLLAGCGHRTDAGDTGGDVPITQRAIAAVALDHAPTSTTHRQATYTDRTDPKGALGADLRYRGGGESDGDLLRVLLRPGAGPADPCGKGAGDGCESRVVDGGRLTLSWTEEEPEEDPGYVTVTLQRADEAVSASWFGDEITGDPRRQDLFIPVDTLEAIAQDARLTLRTSPSVVDAGKELDDWAGGEPDPRAYDRVPSTDESVAWSYWLNRGGYLDYTGLRTSPLKEEFGPGALGGRFEQDTGRPRHPLTVDVLASPRRPGWMAEDVCRTPRFAGHCLHDRGRRGENYLAWVPGPAARSAEIWAVEDRGTEVVAVRFSGTDVPEDQDGAVGLSEWDLVEDLLGSRRLGLETDREVLDATF